MGFKNSMFYVQRHTDKFLRHCRDYARAYVDDIIVFSKTFAEYIAYLREVFITFSKIGLWLKGKKLYLSYPNVTLLGTKVDAFGLTTAKEKLEAIINLSFLTNLAKLEQYIGLTGWLRKYIAKYSQRINPLHRRKTILLKEAPLSGRARASYCNLTTWEPD